MARRARRVVERESDAPVDVARDLEPVANHGRVELDLREDDRVRVEEHRRAAAACGPDLFHRAQRLSLAEPLLPQEAVALHGRNELFRKRVDDAGSHSVEPGCAILAAVEAGSMDRRRLESYRAICEVLIEDEKRRAW